MGILIVAVVALAVVAGLVFAILVARAAHRPHPALPTACGDCVFMVPRAKIYKREVLEEEDGLVHYLCQQRWIEITPVSPRCSLGRSKTLVTTTPT